MSEPIHRYDLDANGKPCSEGYYATDGRTLYLMPPTAELAQPGTPGKIALRLATQEDVDRLLGQCAPASVEHIANCEARPSGDGA